MTLVARHPARIEPPPRMRICPSATGVLSKIDSKATSCGPGIQGAFVQLFVDLLQLRPSKPLGPVLMQLSLRLLQGTRRSCGAHVWARLLHAVDGPQPLTRACDPSFVNPTDA